MGGKRRRYFEQLALPLELELEVRARPRRRRTKAPPDVARVCLTHGATIPPGESLCTGPRGLGRCRAALAPEEPGAP
jgi:hypothetical protein